MTTQETNAFIWKDIWEDLCLNFSKGYFIEKLYNPHILIDDIITEITENEFKNKDNKLLFYDYLNQELKDDPIVQTFLKSEFQILRRHFNIAENSFILGICKDIKAKFSNGFYFQKCLAAVSAIVNSDNPITNEDYFLLRKLSLRIIAEYTKRSIHLNDIKRFIANILDEYTFPDNKQIFTDYPHTINYRNYKTLEGKLDTEKYNFDVTKEMDGLSLQDRINRLQHYFETKKEPVFYIFPIEGFKGNANIAIGDAILYSLKATRFVKKENINIPNPEELGRKDTDKEYVNVAIKTDYFLDHSSLSEAVSKIENVLDLIACYLNLSTELTFDSTTYIVVDKEGECIQASFGDNGVKPVLRYHKSIDLAPNKDYFGSIDKYSFLLDPKKQSETSRKILNALHWNRKGQFLPKDADRIVNYWIAIESLFNVKETVKSGINGSNAERNSKIHLIQEIIASSEIIRFVHEIGWELHGHYRFSPNRHFKNGSRMSNELIIEAQLDNRIGETISLKKFIDNLPLIQGLETNEYMLYKIQEVLDFYKGNELSVKTIEEKLKEIKSDVLMIYRLRNLIVHNAHFDNTLMHYYVEKAQFYSEFFLRNIIEYYRNGKPDLGEILIRIHLRKLKMLESFEFGVVDLFKV